MISDHDIIVFDFETGGTDYRKHEAIQIAGKAYRGKTLEPYPAEQGGEFCSLMKPTDFDALEQGALNVNGKTKAMLEKAPDQEIVWKKFVEWCQKFNKKKGNKWTAPVRAGMNIINFDDDFVRVLNEKHFSKPPVMFHAIYKYDLLDLMAAWFENEPHPGKHNLDALRDYFGMSKEGAHDALVDVQQTGELIMRFLALHRRLRRMTKEDGTPWLKFAGSAAR